MKKRYLLWLLIPLAALLIAAALWMRPGLNAYSLLKECAEQEELSMVLTVDASVSGADSDLTVLIEKRPEATAVSWGDLTLYWADGAILTENGTAYRFSGQDNDSTQLLELAAHAFQTAGLTEKDGVYTLNLSGEDAGQLIRLLTLSESDVQELTLTLTTEDGRVRFLDFTVDSPELQMNTRLEFMETVNDIAIPDAVRSAVAGGLQDAVDLSDGLPRLLKALAGLESTDPKLWQMDLEADCGLLKLESSARICQWRGGITGMEIYGQKLYFTDSALCDENGNILSADAGTGTESAGLIEMMLGLFTQGRLSYSGGSFTMELDRAAMESLAALIAPDTAGMGIEFESGTAALELSGDALNAIHINLSGSLQVLLIRTEVSLNAAITPRPDEIWELPEAVAGALLP